ncbi:MAG TPA: hypothetical protein ENN64_00390, partial [bacterium]|nr:hypothetical protein [bacterium]
MKMKDKLHQFEGAVLEKSDSKEKKNTTNQESEKKGKESSSIEVNNGCGIVYKSNIPTLILLAAILLLITITVGVYIYLFREKTELENGNQDTISDVAEERNLDKFIPVIISGYGTYLFDTKNLEIEDIEFDEKMGISGIEFSNSYNDSIRIRQINLGKSNFELYINNLIEKYRKSNTLLESI